MRVQRTFAFVDLSGFTAFTEAQGDEKAVEMLGLFRTVARAVATDFGVRIAKWLGDGYMFVAVEAHQLVAAICQLAAQLDPLGLPLPMHAGLAGGLVILLEGDDYAGAAVNLASRLCDAAAPDAILATPALAALAPTTVARTPVPALAIPGLARPFDAVRLDYQRAA